MNSGPGHINPSSEVSYLKRRDKGDSHLPCGADTPVRVTMAETVALLACPERSRSVSPGHGIGRRVRQFPSTSRKRLKSLQRVPQKCPPPEKRADLAFSKLEAPYDPFEHTDKLEFP